MSVVASRSILPEYDSLMREDSFQRLFNTLVGMKANHRVIHVR